jgi:hypothetical protein
MKKLLSFSLALRVSILITVLLCLLHLSVIIGIVFFDFAPVEFLWGGRMETADQLLNFEISSLISSLVVLFLLLVRSGWLHIPKMTKVSKIAMWVLFVLFLLNIIGNLLATSAFERGFAVVSALLAVCLLRIALEKKE